jgi:23S rRNA (pseudouridine1915-N3)-methyltransferase
MKQIELICSGALKFRSLQELEKHYLQSINYYVQFTLKTIREVRAESDLQVREKEGERMTAALRDRDWVIALDPSGQRMDSLRFAALVGKKISYHAGRLVFLIGGHAGLGSAVDARVRERISFSDMTIAHDLFRVVFLEQLFRAMTIIHGKTYHR